MRAELQAASAELRNVRVGGWVRVGLKGRVVWWEGAWGAQGRHVCAAVRAGATGAQGIGMWRKERAEMGHE